MELYDEPIDEFVAGFIGSPAMNLLPAIVRDGVAVCRDLRHRLSRDQLASLGGDRVTIGVRPESWAIDDCNGLDVVVDVVETMGPDVVAHCSLPDRTQLVARLPQTDITVGARLRLAARSDAVHVFDSVSTRRLAP